MLDVDATLLAGLQETEVPDSEGLVALVEIHVSTTEVIRRALWNKDVTFEGETYVADEGNFSSIEQDAELGAPSFELNFQNNEHPTTGVALPWTTYRQTTELNEKEVRIKIVKLNLLGFGSIEETEWYISGHKIEGEYFSMRVGMPFDVLKLEVLVPPLGSPICIWNYKDDRCGSQSALKFCNKSVTDCVARFPGQALRYSHWPFLSKMIRFVA